MRVQRGNFPSVSCPFCIFYLLLYSSLSCWSRGNRAYDEIPRNRNIFLFQARFHLTRVLRKDLTVPSPCSSHLRCVSKVRNSYQPLHINNTLYWAFQIFCSPSFAFISVSLPLFLFYFSVVRYSILHIFCRRLDFILSHLCRKYILGSSVRKRVIRTENKWIGKLEKGTCPTAGWWIRSPFQVTDSNVQENYVPLAYIFLLYLSLQVKQLLFLRWKCMLYFTLYPRDKIYFSMLLFNPCRVLNMYVNRIFINGSVTWIHGVTKTVRGNHVIHIQWLHNIEWDGLSWLVI
jgi:hypothetical protein